MTLVRSSRACTPFLCWLARQKGRGATGRLPSPRCRMPPVHPACRGTPTGLGRTPASRATWWRWGCRCAWPHPPSLAPRWGAGAGRVGQLAQAAAQGIRNAERGQSQAPRCSVQHTMLPVWLAPPLPPQRHCLPEPCRLQGQATVRITTTPLYWPTVTNAPTVLHYNVRLERQEPEGPVFVRTIAVPSANATEDVLFEGLQGGQYQVGCGRQGRGGPKSQPWRSLFQHLQLPAQPPRRTSLPWRHPRPGPGAALWSQRLCLLPVASQRSRDRPAGGR